MARIFETYRAAHPDGEDYTLALFEALDQARLDALVARYGKTLKTIKQDLGMLVPIVLCDLYGPDHVETARMPGSRKGAKRRASMLSPAAMILRDYTPHRVAENGNENGSGRAKHRTLFDDPLVQLLMSGPPIHELDIQRSMELPREIEL